MPPHIGMGSRSVSDFRVLVGPGLHNSGHDHWQTRWQETYPQFERVEQTDWDQPRLDVWSCHLNQMLHQSTQPTLIVAHSFGCLATIGGAGFCSRNLAGALLVAPADPEKFHMASQLCNVVLPCPSIVVGSTNDPWMDASRAAEWAKVWGSEFINAGALGHINAESKLGDWPFGLEKLRRLASMINRVPDQRMNLQSTVPL